MGTSVENTHTLSAACPTCGAQHGQSSLKALTRAIQRCCSAKSKGRKKKATSFAKPKEKPGLPLTVCFDRLVRSQNSSTYSHWSRYRSDKKDWLERVGLRFRAYRGLYLPWSRWSVERIYKHPNREMDFANMVGGTKPLIDCLIEQGVIEDDRPNNFECDYTQYPGDRSVTILTLLEYADERPPP